MKRGAVASFEYAVKGCIKGCIASGKFYIDIEFWKSIARAQWAIVQEQTCIGIKGLPGQAGLGIGHRPSSGWTPDPDLAQLRTWIGADADLYAELRTLAAA